MTKIEKTKTSVSEVGFLVFPSYLLKIRRISLKFETGDLQSILLWSLELQPNTQFKA
jgi:hypothetical protein